MSMRARSPRRSMKLCIAGVGSRVGSAIVLGTCASAVLMAVAGPGRELRAQESGTSEVVTVLQPGEQVRFRLTSGIMLQGRFVEVDGTVARVEGGDEPISVSWLEVERAWARERPVRRYAVNGGSVGAVVGGLFGLLLGQVACNPESGIGCDAGVVVLFGLSGAMEGAAVGALVGLATLKVR